MTGSTTKSRKGTPGGAATESVTFWGTRGTLPTPGRKTLKYGGNTSCVEVRGGSGTDALSIILDAGSGVADCGDHALARGDREFHLFLSHLHYDHIIGLTRFKPIFRRDCKVNFYGAGSCDKSLAECLQKFFSHPYFPVEFEALGANPNLFFHAVKEGEEQRLGALRVRFQPLNHPQGAMGYRVDLAPGGTSVVYATDHEHGTEIDEQLVAFAQNATLLLYDTTFPEASYARVRGWGHSTAHVGATIASRAGVKAFGLFHHAPESSDEELETGVLPEAQAVFPRAFLCREGETLNLADLVPGH